MRESIADFVQHFAWAFYGQGCGCGSTFHFNWLADLIGEGNYDENYDPHGFSRITWWIGDRLSAVASRLYS